MSVIKRYDILNLDESINMKDKLIERGLKYIGEDPSNGVSLLVYDNGTGLMFFPPRSISLIGSESNVLNAKRNLEEFLELQESK